MVLEADNNRWASLDAGAMGTLLVAVLISMPFLEFNVAGGWGKTLATGMMVADGCCVLTK